jgi:hypothetical protein
MINLLENSDRLVQKVPLRFKRYLLSKINFDNRLVGIKFSGLPNAFLIKDSVEYPVSKTIPLWMIRMLN